MCSTRMMHVSGVAALVILLAQSGGAQTAAPARAGTDWPMYRHDSAGTGYSPLAQVDTTNVARLTRVWTYGLQSDPSATPRPTGRGGAGGPNSEATPIVVNGVMYLPAADRVVALEPETGKEIWRHPVTGVFRENPFDEQALIRLARNDWHTVLALRQCAIFYVKTQIRHARAFIGSVT